MRSQNLGSQTKHDFTTYRVTMTLQAIEQLSKQLSYVMFDLYNELKTQLAKLCDFSMNLLDNLVQSAPIS